MTAHWSARLTGFSPCDGGAEFARQHKTLKSAWQACERPDWMLWYLHKAEAEHKLMVALACDCAATALPIWKKRYPKDDRPAKAIQTTRAWLRGKATIEQVRQARAAANAAYAAYAAANAAYAAADAAAYAAYAAANAAYAAADAAANAAYAADAADDAADARKKAQRRMAALIRKRVPEPPRLATPAPPEGTK